MMEIIERDRFRSGSDWFNFNFIFIHYDKIKKEYVWDERKKKYFDFPQWFEKKGDPILFWEELIDQDLNWFMKGKVVHISCEGEEGLRLAKILKELP